MYQYNCKIVKVVDGDTVDVDIDLGFDVWLKKQRIRLYGVDTPESRTRDLEEKKYGLAAKAFVESYLPVGSMTLVASSVEFWVSLLLKRSGKEKPFRQQSTNISLENITLSDIMDSLKMISQPDIWRIG